MDCDYPGLLGSIIPYIIIKQSSFISCVRLYPHCLVSRISMKFSKTSTNKGFQRCSSVTTTTLCPPRWRTGSNWVGRWCPSCRLHRSGHVEHCYMCLKSHASKDDLTAKNNGISWDFMVIYWDIISCWTSMNISCNPILLIGNTAMVNGSSRTCKFPTSTMGCKGCWTLGRTD